MLPFRHLHSGFRESDVAIIAGGERTVVPQAKPGLMHLGEVVEARRDTMIKMINNRAVEESVEGPVPWAGWLGKIMCKWV